MIENNPLYLNAVKTKDRLMQIEIKIFFHIADNDDCRWLEKYTGMRILPPLGIEHNRNYSIAKTEIDIQLLVNSGYKIRHRPYFLMQNSTHTVWQINPHTKYGIDACEKGTDTISFSEFLDFFNLTE